MLFCVVITTGRCDCGVPCGRYLWDTRNPDLVDWLVNEHLTGNSSVGRADGLISGIFLASIRSASLEPFIS
jgi:hypothetical protein